MRRTPRELTLTAEELAGDGVLPVLCLDWTGEDRRGELSEFVDSRLSAFGAAPHGLDVDAMYGRLEATAPERGDAPVFLLNEFRARLGELGFVLSVIDAGTDEYRILVTRDEDAAALRELTVDGSPIRAWDEGGDSGETWYSFSCPGCGDPQLWSLPTGQPLPPNDPCEECGTALTDGAGRPAGPYESGPA